MLPLAIQPFQPHQQAAVRQIILAGLVEHWGTLDPNRNPDLNDIATSYAGATFLVATLEDQVVGTGALVPRAGGEAEIVRMSVARQLRRQGVASQILRRLIAQARQDGIQRIILETTATWEDARAFYLRHGFQITHEQDGDVYFRLDL